MSTKYRNDFFNVRWLFWLDEGGMGVPAKVARVNMDGSDSRVLYELPSNRHPEAITINAESLEIYFSTSNRATVGIFL